ncbi:MAG: SHOCT domain-containing protein [Candidatus Moraniibacteriota bacterium]
MMYGYGHGFGFLGGLVSLVFWVAIIWLVVSLLKRHGHLSNGGGCCGGSSTDSKSACCGGKTDNSEGSCCSGKTDSATTLLRERFAKGEVSKEEFEEKLQVLEGKKAV